MKVSATLMGRELRRNINTRHADVGRRFVALDMIIGEKVRIVYTSMAGDDMLVIFETMSCARFNNIHEAEDGSFVCDVQVGNWTDPPEDSELNQNIWKFSEKVIGSVVAGYQYGPEGLVLELNSDYGIGITFEGFGYALKTTHKRVN